MDARSDKLSLPNSYIFTFIRAYTRLDLALIISEEDLVDPIAAKLCIVGALFSLRVRGERIFLQPVESGY